MSLLDDFKFPEGLDPDSKNFLSQNFEVKSVGNGIGNLQASGHDTKGMAYRFYIHPVKSEVKSEEFDMEINDDVQMIQWFKDRNHKPVERVTQLPKELLTFAKRKVSDSGGVAKFEHILSYKDPVDGTEKEDLESVLKAKGIKGKLICKSGAYAENYRRFELGLGTQGLPLSRWDKISLSQIKTLENEGIFTLQQLAALPLSRVEGRFPKDLIKVFNDACHAVNAENKKADITPFANEVLAVRQENSKLKDALEELKTQMSMLVGKKRKARVPSVQENLEKQMETI